MEKVKTAKRKAVLSITEEAFRKLKIESAKKGTTMSALVELWINEKCGE